MQQKKFDVILGALLHDIGKILHRYNDGRNHSTSGYEFLKNSISIENKDLLDCVRFHHSGEIKNASIELDSIAYISYIADNIASFVDRREKKGDVEYGFDKKTALYSVFNILNGNGESKVYSAKTLDRKEGMNVPGEKAELREDFYGKVVDGIKDNLKYMSKTNSYLNSYLQVLENYLSFIPSSTSKKEQADISLYDHVKLTSLFATCILDYLEDKNIKDYRKILFENSADFYKEKAFLLFLIDFSGIQNFIYKSVKKKALKNLRTKSFYLEIIMEVFVDEILERLEYSRANLIFSGGGNAYMVLANTDKIKNELTNISKEINEWLLETFGIDIFLSTGFVEASANDFRNEPKGSYAELYQKLSGISNKNKNHRYSAEQLKRINQRNYPQNERECKICYRLDKLTQEDECQYCSGISLASNELMDEKKEFFVVMKDSEKSSENNLSLPFGKNLYFMERSKLLDKLESSVNYVRAYTKNKPYTGEELSSRLWFGDYSYSKFVEELVSDKGVERIAVLRADVDNLGKTMVSGFEQKYNTFSRTSTLSRNMSMFFKYEINRILEEPKYHLREKGERKISVVYSGGDDVFVVGSWEDVIGFAVDLRNALKDFSLNSLTISAGIGIYDSNYPIYNMALEVGKLEETAKSNEYKIDGNIKQKNSVCLFDKELSFSWDEFEFKVLGEKFILIREFMKINDEIGNSFLYKLIELLRGIEKGKLINIARLAYVLARHEPNDKDKFKKDMYRSFSSSVYGWSRNTKDRKEFLAAIYIYVYLERRKNNDNSVGNN